MYLLDNKPDRAGGGWMGFNVPQDSMIVFSSEWMSKYGVSRPWTLFYCLIKALTIFAMGFADWS